MARKAPLDLSRRERQIMDIVYRPGRATPSRAEQTNNPKKLAPPGGP